MNRKKPVPSRREKLQASLGVEMHVPAIEGHPKPKEIYESWEGDRVEIVLVSYYESTSEYMVTYRGLKTKSLFSERVRYFQGLNQGMDAKKTKRWVKVP